jgi:predicted RNase H-like HicB family nuclease
MIPKYHINLFGSEPDDAWIADVLYLQSCSAFGDTPAEALAEIELAIEGWLAVAREDGLPNSRAPLPRADPRRRVRSSRPIFKIAVGAG